MSKYDEIYKSITLDILNNGRNDYGENVRTKYADGSLAYTKSKFGVQIRFDINEVPIPTTKKLAAKTAIKEMLLFWVHQTVKKSDFESWNVKVWDEWFLPDDTLGRSYAYQFESRPHKEVVKVNRKHKIKHNDKLDPIVVGVEKESNYTNTSSKYIGKICDTVNHGKYRVLDVYNVEGKQNRKALIQFIETKNIKEVDLSMIIKSQDIGDNYYRVYFGVGYLGEGYSVKNFTEDEKSWLYRKWYYMLKRCYDHNDREFKNYGEKGVFVDERWHSFENYIKDIRQIPQYFLAKQDNFKGWSVDKDYYGANYYGKESCVWIKDGENLSYRNAHNPFYLIKPNGEKELYLTYADAEKDYTLSNLNKIVKGEREHVRRFNVEIINTSQDELYRYKLSKNQVVELIHNIKNSPSSRRLMTSFWNYTDVESKALQECAFQTQWNVRDGKLDLILTQRSCDWGLGACFNHFQYYVLQRMIAQVCNLEPGEFIHHIGSCHIYDRHEDSLKEQVSRQTYSSPELWINPDVKDFFDFTPDDFKLIDYESGDKVEMEVAI